MKFSKIMRLPEKLPCDKRIHMIVGATVMAIALATFGFGRIEVLGAIVVTVLMAWVIEVYQLYTKSGTYDNWDAIAVVFGGALVVMPYVFRVW